MKLLLPPLLAASALLALAADQPFAEISNLTATAILGWYAWHTATRTIPKLIDDFRGELAAQRVEHQSDREFILRESAQLRHDHHADTAAIIQSLYELSTSINQLTKHTEPTRPLARWRNDE